MAPAKKSKKTADSINSRLALVMYVLRSRTIHKQLADVDHLQEVRKGYESHNADAIVTNTAVSQSKLNQRLISLSLQSPWDTSPPSRRFDLARQSL